MVRPISNNYQIKEQRARKILEERKIPITRAAKRCGVSREFLSMVLSGHKKPSDKVRHGLAKLLRLPQKDLFQPTNETG